MSCMGDGVFRRIGCAKARRNAGSPCQRYIERNLMAAQHRVSVGPVVCGSDSLFLISGPCVIEDEPIMMRTAEGLKTLSQRLNLPLIFKSSFMKDNRSAMEHFHGPGLDKGLALLARIRDAFDVPIITDVHFPEQIGPTAEVATVENLRRTYGGRMSFLDEAEQRLKEDLRHVE